MKLDKEYVKENIFLNDYYINEALMNNDMKADGKNLYIGIEPTGALESAADTVLVEHGHTPMFTEGADGRIDLDGWYEFFLICGKDRCVSLIAIPENTEQDILFEEFELPVDEDTKKLLYERVVSLFGEECWKGAFSTAERKGQ